jgi:hypothetical protein
VSTLRGAAAEPAAEATAAAEPDPAAEAAAEVAAALVDEDSEAVLVEEQAALATASAATVATAAMVVGLNRVVRAGRKIDTGFSFLRQLPAHGPGVWALVGLRS